MFNWKECTYVQKDINESDDDFDSTEDNELTSLSLFFQEGPVVNVENIEERLRAMNLHMVQIKGEKLSSQEYEKDITVQQKKGKQYSPRSHLHLWWINVRQNYYTTYLLLRRRKV